MERLSPQDAVFLSVENEFSHMSIAAMLLFSGRPPTEGEIEDMIESRLHLTPRLRQRLRFVPLHAGTPVWCDDPHFNLRYHVRHSALPAPGSEEQLRTLAGRVMSQQLDRTKPLWELWVIEGLADGGWCMLLKLHHCVADGIAAVDLIERLLDKKARVKRGSAKPWRPERQPSRGELVRGALSERLQGPRVILDAIGNAVRNPADASRDMGDFLDGLWAMRPGMDLEAETSLNGRIGVHRGWNWASASLTTVKEIRTAHGCTVNDVVLAAIALGFRELLKTRREKVKDHMLRTLVPVSTRLEEEHDTPNNRVSSMFVELPVGIADAGKCLREIAGRTQRLKLHHQMIPGKTMMNMSILVPPVLMDAETRLFTSQEFTWVQTIATNVPGPRKPLYAAGRKLETVYLYVPIMNGVRMGVAIFSYLDNITFAVTSDYDHVRDANVLCSGIEAAIADLAG